MLKERDIAVPAGHFSSGTGLDTCTTTLHWHEISFHVSIAVLLQLKFSNGLTTTSTYRRRSRSLGRESNHLSSPCRVFCHICCVTRRHLVKFRNQLTTESVGRFRVLFEFLITYLKLKATRSPGKRMSPNPIMSYPFHESNSLGIFRTIGRLGPSSVPRAT